MKKILIGLIVFILLFVTAAAKDGIVNDVYQLAVIHYNPVVSRTIIDREYWDEGKFSHSFKQERIVFRINGKLYYSNGYFGRFSVAGDTRRKDIHNSWVYDGEDGIPKAGDAIVYYNTREGYCYMYVLIAGDGSDDLDKKTGPGDWTEADKIPVIESEAVRNYYNNRP